MAHCEVLGISDMSKSYSGGGSSNAAFRCQYCSNLFVTATTITADSEVLLLYQKTNFLNCGSSTARQQSVFLNSGIAADLQRLEVLMWTTQQV